MKYFHTVTTIDEVYFLKKYKGFLINLTDHNFIYDSIGKINYEDRKTFFLDFPNKGFSRNKCMGGSEGTFIFYPPCIKFSKS